MKAILLRRPGGPEALEYVEVPTPVPGEGKVLVKADTIGVSMPEVLVRRGTYAWMPPLPAIPGIELSGTVVAHGPNTAEPALGQPVFVSARDLPARAGCYAEYIAVPARAAHPLPPGCSLEAAACGAGLIEPTHMRVTRSETTIGARGTALTGRHGQHFRRLIETSTEEMGHPERQARSGEIPAWGQPQRPLQMLDCGIVLAGVHAEKATEVPTAGAARIERNGTVDQGDGSVGVLTGHTKDRRGVGENAGIVVGDGQSLLRQSDRFAAASLRISWTFAEMPAGHHQAASGTKPNRCRSAP
jgi:hypothetical protein